MIAFGSFTQTIVSTNGGSGSISVSYPSGIIAGDALVLCIINTNPFSQSTPTGWSAPVQSNPTVNGNLAAYVWEKTALGTESGTVSSTLGTGSTGSSGIGVMLRYTKTLTTGPFGTTISTNSGATNSTSSTAAGTLSPAPGPTDLVVRFYTFAQNTAATGLTMTNPGGTWTTRGNLVSVGTSSIFANGLVFADKVAGTDNQTVSTNSQTGSWMVIDIDLKAAPPVQERNFLNQAMVRASCR